MATNGKRKSVSAAPPRPVLRSTADFARYVGLARTTVSRVLNGQPGLKRKTIDRVNRALAETGFTPNAYALHLKGKRTAMIGVCLQDIASPLAVRKLAALQGALRGRGLSTLIAIAASGTTREVVRQFLSLRVEAVVFLGTFSAEELEQRLAELLVHGTPHLVMDGPPLKRAHAVVLDRAAGMAAVTRHFLALGHRAFGLLGFPKTTGPHEGLSGVRTALVAAGLDFEASVRVIDDLHSGPRGDAFAYGRTLASLVAMIAPPLRPTALLAYDDLMALGALRGLQEAGAQLARGIAVAGFGSQETTQHLSPSLTMLDPDIASSTAAAVEILTEEIETPGRSKASVRWITPRLVP